MPLLPGWGHVQTWAIPRGSALRPPAPPTYGSREWELQVREVYDISRTLTSERKALAEKWAGGPGTATPAGQWNEIACDLCVREGLSVPRTARVLALLGVAQSDAFVACWDSKYAYDCCRPITAIHEAIDASWRPYLQTPAFPSYPSGHASTSGAASTVLSYLFPTAALDLARLATEARDSRLYAGIHTRIDNDVGFDLGRSIGAAVIARAARDRSP